MALVKITDNAVWTSQIVGGPEIVDRIHALSPQQPIDLVIEGEPVRFLKMQDGKDGRPTNGIRPDVVSKPFWDRMQRRRGETVRLSLRSSAADPYLASMTALLSEWDSPEDAAAYDHL